ncbi:MAG: A/G-specific adenine glycosylase [Bacteroidetes bacterium]|nr:A/G-specific adenine glycosylase [Bacteroidota bacterium]
MKEFGRKVISWYKKNKRDLPWRNTEDPYKIWLSEVILQQTRVDQGMAYYHRFTETFLDVHALAAASEDEILKLWQGLGYYSRARNLHAASKDIVERFNGDFPDNYDDIKSLKGIGEYTAAAIASFAFKLPHAVVDGNVFRLLSRYFGIKTPIDSSSGKKEFTELANRLLGNHQPHTFNQAMMEFGSKQCKPVSPDCLNCPLQDTCFAFEKKIVSVLPVKSKKTKIRKRYFHYLVIREKDNFFIRQRTEKDIWIGLHDFPMIETETAISGNKVMSTKEWKTHFATKKSEVVRVSNEFKHILSHQHIHATFYEIKSDLKMFKEEKQHWKKVNSDTVKEFAVPRLIEEYLKQMVQFKKPIN